MGKYNDSSAMTTSQLTIIKDRIDAELARRNGNGSLANYSNLAFSEPPLARNGYQGIRKEYGEKTIDLLLKICDYKDLVLTEAGGVIPDAFNYEDMTALLDILSGEERSGVSADNVNNGLADKAEVSSCRGNCTGLCVGSCIDMCNGCSGCAASCGSSCANGCREDCTGGAFK